MSFVLAAASTPGLSLATGPLAAARAAALAAMLALSAGPAMAEVATIEGTATGRERIALRPGAVLEVELLDISRADAPPEAGPSGDTAALVGPTWVAEDIQGRGVIDDLQSHITFTAEGQAHGSGGCNTFTGGCTLDGTHLALGPLAGTRKACPPAIMDQETRFYEALGEARGYRFENGLLFLLDDQGAPVMRLWRRS